MDLPASMFLRPTPGDDDLLGFRYDFTLDSKSLPDAVDEVVTEAENGDLIIEGMAAVFEGIDRQGENFAPGAFQRGIKSFLGGSAPLCFNHKSDYVLGKVLELEEIPDKGLRMKARVDGAVKNHPVLGTLYEQIKKGTISALSVGGYFKRGLVEGGRKIIDMDFTEVSTTATPVHPGASFAVVAGKALTSDLHIPDNIREPNVPEEEIRDEDFWRIQESLNSLSYVFSKLEKRGKKDDTNNPERAVVLDD